MQLTHEQEQAFKDIREWLQGPNPEFILAGYAGTGKTTLLAYLIAELNLNPIICTPTAKAALVLRNKLKSPLLRIGTIHSFLYQPKSSSNQKLHLMEREYEAIGDKTTQNAQKLFRRICAERREVIKGKPHFALKNGEDHTDEELIIVDEASMVTRQMHKDLFERARKVLYVGDGAQLPPVGDSGFFHQTAPDAMLVNIQRQALDNPIIRLAQLIREGQEPSRYRHPGCELRAKSEMSKDEYLQADQVLIGKNRGRHQLNRFFREHRWGPGHARAALLMPGEKLICKQNAVKLDPLLVNGNLFKVVSDESLAPWRKVSQIPYRPISCPTESTLLQLWEGEDMSYCDMFLGLLLHNYYEDVEHVDSALMPDHGARYAMGYVDFDYGYGITVHSSQGSEWDNVVVCDDWGGNDRQRWLYTAVTRAKQKLLWVK